MEAGGLGDGDFGEDAKGEDLFDDAEGFDMAFDFVVGERVGREAFVVELAEGGFIFEERAIGDAGAAAEKLLDRAMKPDEDGGVLAEKRDVLRLSGGAAAEGNNARAAVFDGFANKASELFVLDFAEAGLAGAGEDGGDVEAGGLDDVLIEVHMLPANLAGEQASGGGFAAAHEADQADKLRRGRAVRDWVHFAREEARRFGITGASGC